MSLQKTAALSRKFGSNEEFVLSGGGNTSFKDEKHLLIKASGVKLATITEEGFVAMERKPLDDIWKKAYSNDPDRREAEVLQDLMNARSEGEEKRPSVETLLHALFPFPYVFHMHPPLVNGLTCSKGGEEEARRLFGEEFVWIPTVNPGYILAVTVRDTIRRYQEGGRDFPQIVFLQNHGVFTAANTLEEVEALYNRIFDTLNRSLVRKPDFAPVDHDKTIEHEAHQWLRQYGVSLFFTNREIERLVRNESSFYPVSSAFSPDHIVYYGHEPLFIRTESLTKDAFEKDVSSYRERNGEPPRIIAIQGLGVFACGADGNKAQTSKELFLDAVKIAVYSESFGGCRFMPEEQITFIRNWEVERYRSRVSFK